MNDQPQYNTQIHKRAEKELSSITGSEGDELLQRLRNLKYEESPTNTAYTKPLEDHKNLFVVKSDGYRAIATFTKPEIRILLIGPRRTVYDRLDVAKDRGGLD